MNVRNYLIEHSGFDWEKLFEPWAWLVAGALSVWLVNRLGDVFVIHDDGTIWMLDVGAGSYKQVSDSKDTFCAHADDSKEMRNWFAIDLVDALVRKGTTLAPGQCYSFKTPPVLGGEYRVENICVLSFESHLGGYGKLHEQIKDIPDGDQVVVRVKQ